MDNQGNNYTEEQKAIIAHRDGPAYVVAGAGTGKTFTMTARVQALIESGGSTGTYLSVDIYECCCAGNGPAGA